MIQTLILVLCSFVLMSCVTSPLGRKQLIFVPESQMNEMGAQAFQQLKQTEKVDSDPAVKKYVMCVVNPLLAAAQGQTDISDWDVQVFKSDTVNAFALPGGKIGVYTGILKVAKSDAQLATVIGHEIGHVIAKHGAERVSQQAGSQLGLAALGKLTQNNPKSGVLMGLLGVGLQFGVLLPYSRTQESEADLIGLDLMARAGFNPAQSVELWKNMSQSKGGKAPPEFMSTHPADETRIQNLQAHLPEANLKYDQARAAKLSPLCDSSHLHL